MGEPGLDVVVVLAADAPAGARHRDRHQRELELAAGELTQLAGAVHQRVHRVAEEGGEQQVDHRAQAGGGGADRGAGDDRLGERGVAHARGAEFGHQLGALGRHPFAEHQHAGVAAHLLGQRLADRFVDSNAGHDGNLLVGVQARVQA
jgi:hypothetical protein